MKHHLAQIEERLNDFGARKSRRAINWLGSAWKWVASSPDGDAWDKILHSEAELIESNNHHYKINQELLRLTNDIHQGTREVQVYTNHIGNGGDEQIRTSALE